MLVTVMSYKYLLYKGIGHWEEAEGQFLLGAEEKKIIFYSPPCPLPPAPLPLPQSSLQFKRLEKITAGS